MADLITKHYQSDFTIPIKLLKSEEGEVYPFVIEFTTYGSPYIASWDGENGVNLLNAPTAADEYAIVKIDKGGLNIGELMQKTTFYVSAEDWKDGKIHKVFSGATGYELVGSKDDVDGEEMTLPITYDMNLIKGDKGDPFTYDDFTEEQIALLQQPANDAATIAYNKAQLAEDAAASATTAANMANTSTSEAQEEIIKVKQATENANNATSTANTAIANTEQATSDAKDAITNANTAIINTEKATSDANEATINANTAAINATQSASDADEATIDAIQATTNANNATNNANTAANTANQATDDANTAVVNAEKATSDANEAAEAANLAKENADKAALDANTAISELSEVTDIEINNLF